MLTGKERSYLKGLAHNLDPVVYIGKEDLTQNVLDEMERCLEARELIKVKLQEGSSLNPKDVANEVVEKLGAEFVQSIGHKFTIYRRSHTLPVEKRIDLKMAVRKSYK